MKHDSVTQPSGSRSTARSRRLTTVAGRAFASGRAASVLLTCVLAAAVACGSSKSSSQSGRNQSLGPTMGFGTDTDASSRGGDVTITPSMPTVTVVTGQPPPTVPFTCKVNGTASPATWAFDQAAIGSISSNGVFTPTGTSGGTGHATGTCGGISVMVAVTVTLQTTQNGDPAWSASLPPPGPGGYGGVGGDGPGAPASAAQVIALAGAPAADSTVKWIYPYDATVWPLSMLAPLLQWQSGGHTFDSAYLHIEETSFEYKGTFASNAKGAPFTNLPIPQAAWDSAGYSNSGEPLKVSLVLGEGGKTYGPYVESWTIAPANLQGVIYYNSYGTSLVTNSATDGLDQYGQQYGAATLSILSRATSPKLVAGVSSLNPTGDGTGCRVCHTVSANGNALVTQASNFGASDYSDTVQVNLANDTTGGAGTPLPTTNLAFPALYRDGSLLLSSAGGMINGDSATRLYALPAGTLVPGVTGLPAGFQAALPAFSPDGHHVSFNFWSGSLGNLRADQISLAMLDFDGTSAFSNPRVIYTPPNGPTGQVSATFSSFLPTSAGIVFGLALPASGWGFTWKGNTSELWWADVATGKARRLDRLNGYDASGALYLPDNSKGTNPTHMAAQDATLNYEPTVCPLAGGGYAWVVFTSRRMYGNLAQLDPWTSDPRVYPWRDQITDKKLWVAAIDLNAPPGTDPSHPAFYLPAQELHAGNARGFWSFGSCKADGMLCGEGADCCGGYCRAGDGGGLECTGVSGPCSQNYEKCSKDSDCCNPAVQCINQVCSPPPPR